MNNLEILVLGSKDFNEIEKYLEVQQNILIYLDQAKLNKGFTFTWQATLLYNKLNET